MSPSRPSRLQTVRTMEGGKADWGIAVEVPVEIGLDGEPWAVMMASPADFEDLAVGFALSEGMVAAFEDIETVEAKSYPEGWTVDISLKSGAGPARQKRPRFLEGRTGCGLCGVETLADAIRPAGPLPEGDIPSREAVEKAFAELDRSQPLNQETRSVHGAAFCDCEGSILLVREDVGRHNALDKLIGALVRTGHDRTSGFIIMTSRCSFELVQKVASIGVPLLATVSAPTSLALDLAAAVGLKLVARGTDGALILFDGETD